MAADNNLELNRLAAIFALDDLERRYPVISRGTLLLGVIFSHCGSSLRITEFANIASRYYPPCALHTLVHGVADGTAIGISFQRST